MQDPARRSLARSVGMQSVYEWCGLLLPHCRSSIVALAVFVTVLTAGFAVPGQAASSILTARDQGNGEVLLEWPAQATMVSYRVERTATGIQATSIEAGNHLNVMDIAGIASAYTYRLLARQASGAEKEIATLSYQAPASVMARVTQAQGRAPQLRSALGTNLGGINYYATQVPFVDMMKSASNWISGDSTNWDNRAALDLDTNGWVKSLAPGTIARTFVAPQVAGETGNRFPAGQYLVRYKGEGTLEFGFGASVVAGSQKPGELLIQVTPTLGSLYLHIETTNSANYIRDIEILMPGGICEGDAFVHVSAAAECGSKRFLSFASHSQSIVFYPVFLERLRNYSVLRFMDWMKTNYSTVTTWVQRTKPASRTWAKESGAPAEIMIALANKLAAHPWVNMPHASDDAYAQSFAKMVKGRLDPALGVYTEYSNEVWNSFFSQAAYASEQGAARVPAIDSAQYHALRSRTTGQLFKNVLGTARVVAVLGAQSNNSWSATRGLDYLTTEYGAASVGINAVAVAPYFGLTPDPAAAGIYTAMSQEALVNHVTAKVLPISKAAMQNYRTLATKYGVRLISYEGGQHMVGIKGAENNAALTALFQAVNRDPRIKQVYLDYLDNWKKAGGELFVHFTDTGRYDKWGSWGALEYITQTRASAPKFDAVQTFMELNPVWWLQ